ncbi:MAG: hypothetical protein ACREEG_14065 [Phenylobacterium sp.]
MRAGRLPLAMLIAAACATTAVAAAKPSVKLQTERAFVAADAVGATSGSCRASIGKSRALTLVRYCLYVTSATHPPCNTANQCEVIVDHIRQMCPSEVGKRLPCSAGFKSIDWTRIKGLAAR